MKSQLRTAEASAKKSEDFLAMIKPKFNEARKTKAWPIVIDDHQVDAEEAADCLKKASAKLKTLQAKCVDLQTPCSNLDEELARVLVIEMSP